MNTVHVRIMDVKRGSLLQVAGGFVIADTLSATPGSPDGKIKPELFWFDTDGRRHFPNPTRGTLVVGVPTFRTQEYGQVRGGYGHALLNAVPDQKVQGLCAGSRNAAMSVWSSGTALSGVTCPSCRRMIGLVNHGRGWGRHGYEGKSA